MTCGDRDECWYLSCGSGGFCHNIDFGGGFYCECPSAYEEFRICTNCTCDNLLIDSQSVLQIGSRAIYVVVLVCMFMTRKHPVQLDLVYEMKDTRTIWSKYIEVFDCLACR